MGARDYTWQAGTLDKVRVYRSPAGDIATIYYPETGDATAFQQKLQRLQRAVGEKGLGAYADMEQGKPVLRLTSFQNDKQLLELLQECELVEGKQSSRRISNGQLRKDGLMPPRKPFDMVQFGSMLALTGLGLMTAQGFYEVHLADNLDKHPYKPLEENDGKPSELALAVKKKLDDLQPKLEEARKAYDDKVKQLKEAHDKSKSKEKFIPPAFVPPTVELTKEELDEYQRFFDNKGDQYLYQTEAYRFVQQREGGKGPGFELKTLTYTEADRQSLKKTGQNDKSAGLTYVGAYSIQLMYGGGQAMLDFNDMSRGLMSYLDSQQMQLVGQNWNGPHQSQNVQRGAIRDIHLAVQKDPIGIVGWLGVYANARMTLGGVERFNKAGGLSALSERLGLRQTASDEESREGTQQTAPQFDAGLMGIGITVKNAEAQEAGEGTVQKKASSSENDVVKDGLLLNYRLFGGFLSAFSDLVAAAVPQLPKDRVDELKASRNPLNKAYGYLAQAPLALQGFFGIIDKPFSAVFGFQSETTPFTQFTVVTRNVLFAAARVVISRGKKGGETADYADALDPMYAMISNIVINEPQAKRAAVMEQSAEYLAAHLLGTGVIPMPKDKEKEEVAAEVKATILERVQQRVADVERNPFMRVMQHGGPATEMAAQSQPRGAGQSQVQWIPGTRINADGTMIQEGQRANEFEGLANGQQGASAQEMQIAQMAEAHNRYAKQQGQMVPEHS